MEEVVSQSVDNDERSEEHIMWFIVLPQQNTFYQSPAISGAKLQPVESGQYDLFICISISPEGQASANLLMLLGTRSITIRNAFKGGNIPLIAAQIALEKIPHGGEVSDGMLSLRGKPRATRGVIGEPLSGVELCGNSHG
ncbi:hypothetical protein CU663_19195 [Pseudomonas syringae pv. actinidifoliorum]|nr:hypothetical protein [Pseudomonas syringae pv. actinidifoliorum]